VTLDNPMMTWGQPYQTPNHLHSEELVTSLETEPARPNFPSQTRQAEEMPVRIINEPRPPAQQQLPTPGSDIAGDTLRISPFILGKLSQVL
jgi:hypothetical protein